MNDPTLNRQQAKITTHHPLKVLQIGEGNFIRAFVDWMIHRCNQQNLFRGSIVVTQPRPSGSGKLEKVKRQDGLFTLVTRGLQDGRIIDKAEVISSIEKLVDPYQEWEQFMALAEEPQLQFIFSNTTEAGLVYTEEKFDDSQPILSFPGKLTAFLYRRYQKLGDQAGMYIFPLELLEQNGDRLRDIVLQHADHWDLGDDFKTWVVDQNYFINSLVDRIVTGYPQKDGEEIQQSLGYRDALLTVTEPYHLWVLEGDKEIAEKLPLHEAGLSVIWVKDLAPYQLRKVRILNGAHTFMMPIAYLQGYDTVGQAVSDPELRRKIDQFLIEEVIPVLPFPKEESEQYRKQIMERFSNPYMEHKLLDLSLNCISKSRVRLLPTLKEYVHLKGEIPAQLSLSLAYLLRFYRCRQEGEKWVGYRWKEGQKEEYLLQDAPNLLSAFAANWAEYEETKDLEKLIQRLLSDSELWGTSFPAFFETKEQYAQFSQTIYSHLDHILK